MPYFNFFREQIHYEDHGKGAAVVFLHGWGNNLDIWSHAINEISGKRIIRLDLPGFGQSSYHGDRSNYFPYSTELIKEAIASLDPGSFSIVGNSIGGIIAVLLACHTPTINSLVIDSCPLLGFECMSTKPKLFGIHPLISFPLLFMTKSRRIREKLLRNTFHDRESIENEDYEKFVAGFGQGSNLARYSSINALASMEIIPMIKKISCPITYVYGSKNNTINVRMIREHANRENLPIDFLEIPDAGHYPQIEQPRIYFNKIIKLI